MVEGGLVDIILHKRASVVCFLLFDFCGWMLERLVLLGRYCFR